MPAGAQSVNGQVRDAEADRPLPGATVTVKGTDRGVAASIDGRFQFRLAASGAYVLVVRHVGYEQQERTVYLEPDTTRTLTIALQPLTLSLAELVVEEAMNPLEADRRAVGRIDGSDLDRTRGQTLGETVSQLPGVTALKTGPAIQKPVVRGLHSDRIVVLSHGIRQEGQQWGSEHAPAIDPFAPAEIQVVKGAAGVEYGPGAIGGVVRLEPEPLPTAPGVGGEVMMNGFTNNRQGAGSVRVDGGLGGAPGLGWRLQGSLRRAGDAHTPSGVIGNSAFAEHNLAATVGYQKDRAGVSIHASRFNTELGIFTGAHSATVEDFERATDRAAAYDFSYAIDAPKQTIVHNLLAVDAHLDLASGERLTARYGLQQNVRREFDAHCRFCEDPGAEPAFDLTLLTHTLDLTLRTRPLGDAFAVVGLSGTNQANTNGEAGLLIPNFRALTGGGFVRATWLRGDWTLEAGSRLDVRHLRAFPRVRGTGGFQRQVTRSLGVSSVVGATWQFAERWSVSANASTAWRPASVNELYSSGVHHGTAQFERGDPTLSAERMLGTDATLRHQGRRVRSEVSVYSNWSRNFISLLPTRETVVTIRGVFPEFITTQTGARLRGVDGMLEADWSQTVTTGATWSLVRGTDSTNDQPLFGMPSDRATLYGTVALPSRSFVRDGDLRIETTLVRKQTRMPEGIDLASAPEGYALLGASIGADVEIGTLPIRWRLSVQNLFNTAYRDILSRYRYFVDEPGRTVVLRIRVPFGRTV
jgi:iron complex outermembrane receptor protein